MEKRASLAGVWPSASAIGMPTRIVGAATFGAASVHAAIVDEATVGVATIDAATVDAATVGAANVGAATVGAATVGAANVGAATVTSGRGWTGDAELSAPVLRCMKPETNDVDILDSIFFHIESADS